MYEWLEYLASQSHTFGALGIAEAVLFLWKEHFMSSPLYEQINTLLLHKGSNQQGWFPTADHKLPLTEDLSRFHISSSDLPSCSTMSLHSSEIVKANRQAVVCISNTLASKEEEVVGETDVVHSSCRVACNEIADLIIVQNALIENYVRESTLTQVSHILKVQKLVAQCDLMARIIKLEEYESREEIHEDCSPAPLPPTII